MTCGQWIVLFEKDFWSKNEFTLNKKSYFESVYGCQFKKLEESRTLSVGYVTSMIDQQGEPNSCARYVFYRAIVSLCYFAKLPMEQILAKKPKYKKTSTRDIPPDTTIEAIGDAIALPENQWIYAILAIYGLRPHELFHLVELESIFTYPHYIKVSKNVKNKKPRVIFPSCVEWLDRWGVLEFGSLPLKSPNQYSNKKLGSIINDKVFKNLPLTAYYLRDAYAIRCARHGVPDSICADWMGHSLAVHHEKYLCYINVSDYVDAWVKFISPKAP